MTCIFVGPQISRPVEDIAGKNIIFLNTFLPLLTLREANLSFYLFVFSRVFARGPIYVLGGLLKYIFKYLFIFTYIIIKGLSLVNALQKTKR